MDLILRTLSTKAQLEIFKRIGCLNLINPLKISFDYVLCLKYQDNRTLARQLMELASFESADQIMEDSTTDLPVATLYGSMTRVENDVRPEVMRFTYADFGVRTNNVLWHRRRDLLSRFLVGTQPMDEEIFQTISMFKELEAAGALLQGPIDQQYASYQKSKKSNFQRVVKNTKSMVNVMRMAKESFAVAAAAAAGSGSTSNNNSPVKHGGTSLSPLQTSLAVNTSGLASVSLDSAEGTKTSATHALAAFTPQRQASMVNNNTDGTTPATAGTQPTGSFAAFSPEKGSMSPTSKSAVAQVANLVQTTMIAQRKQRESG